MWASINKAQQPDEASEQEQKNTHTVRPREDRISPAQKTAVHSAASAYASRTPFLWGRPCAVPLEQKESGKRQRCGERKQYGRRGGGRAGRSERCYSSAPAKLCVPRRGCFVSAHVLIIATHHHRPNLSLRMPFSSW